MVSLQADGQLYLQETPIDPETLIPAYPAISEANPDIRIFVRGDRTIAYGEVVQVMGRIQNAGFSRVALVAELPQEG